jgi:hypothetical protein
MKSTLLTGLEDMEWLLKVHLPNVDKSYLTGSAVLFGNEDSPSRIRLYKTSSPTIWDDPEIFIMDKEG